MRIKDPQKRLLSVWGHVDDVHNRLIRKNVVGPRVLDVGCGYGALTDYMRREGFEAVGVDEDRQSVAAGGEMFSQANLILADAGKLDFPDGHFDTVVLKDALHHILKADDPSCVLDEIFRILRAGGSLVRSTPTPSR